jgi:hypothetical protein
MFLVFLRRKLYASGMLGTVGSFELQAKDGWMGCLLLGRNPVRRRPRTELSLARRRCPCRLFWTEIRHLSRSSVLPYVHTISEQFFALRLMRLSLRLPCRGSKGCFSAAFPVDATSKALSSYVLLVLAGNLVGTDVDVLSGETFCGFLLARATSAARPSLLRCRLPVSCNRTKLLDQLTIATNGSHDYGALETTC